MLNIKWDYAPKRAQLEQILKEVEPFIYPATIKDKLLVIPDNYKELITPGICKGLSKPFYEYQYKSDGISFILESKYLNYLKECAQREERKKRKLEALSVEIAKLKKSCSQTWRDQNWIEKHIGSYYTKDLSYEYYWTLIGDNYSVDWKGNIILEAQTLKKIKEVNNDKLLKPSSFLNRKFKNPKGYSAGILDKTYTKLEPERDYGVYAILADDEIIYIGSTSRSFDIRIKEHLSLINSGSKQIALYDLVRKLQQEGKEISWMPIINCKTLKTNKELTKDDIESMEFGFITYFQPIGNLAGRSSPFKYSSAETR